MKYCPSCRLPMILAQAQREPSPVEFYWQCANTLCNYDEPILYIEGSENDGETKHE